jgi:hypothetical protein
MIEELITSLVGRLAPSSGDDLSGFLMDCEAYLAEDDLVFAKVDVGSGPNSRNMVNARLLVASTALSIQHIHNALRAAWSKLAYHEFQATGCKWYSDAMVMRFVTAVPESRLLVTGTFVASGGAYPKVAAEFGRDFAAISGPLPAWRS